LMPRSASAATRSASSALMAAAVALPSSTCDFTADAMAGALLREARVEREVLGELGHAGAQRRDVRAALERRRDDVGDLGELLGAKAARGERRGADADTGGDHRRARVEGHGVAVHGDADLVQEVLRLLAVERRVAQVDQDQ